MKRFLAVFFAAAYGVTTRLLFGVLNDYMGVMSLGFLALVPVFIGFLTVILMPKKNVSNGISAFFWPWLTSLVILIITVFASIEGTICWILIYPFFAVLAGIGGLVAYLLRRSDGGDNVSDQEKNDWEKPSTLKVSLLLILPVMAGFVEGDRTSDTQQFIISRSITIDAPPAVVWKELTHINKLTASEKHWSLAHFLGFPRHLETDLDSAFEGGKRLAIYENGLRFEETISKYTPQKLMVLDMKIDPRKIPANVMDEHIVIGGKHVNILQDTYKLDSLPNGGSRLTLSSKFIINTPFNWYAGIWSRYLMSDILQGELNLVGNRARINNPAQ